MLAKIDYITRFYSIINVSAPFTLYFSFRQVNSVWVKTSHNLNKHCWKKGDFVLKPRYNFNIIDFEKKLKAAEQPVIRRISFSEIY